MTQPSARADAPWPAPGYAWYVVALLNLAYLVSFIDRGILSLLVQPIKASLHLSDTQMGLVHGTAFGVFFSVMAIPCGWLADRTNRMRLVSVGIALWSLMTAACGLASSFTHLFLARMGVGIGEATLSPTAPSLLADYFPPERRSLPLSIYVMAAGTGGGLSLVAGGFVASLVADRTHITLPLIGTYEPWQIVLFAVGLPGLLVSLAFAYTREPVRRDAGDPDASAGELWSVLKSRRAILVPHVAGFCIYQIFAYGFTTWIPAFYIRIHGFSIPDVGYRFGVMQLVCSIPGGIIAGLMARWLWQRGRRDSNLLTSAISLGLTPIPVALALWLTDPTLSLIAMMPVIVLSNMPGGVSAAAIQEIIPNRLRGRVTAVYYAAISLVGIAGGPLIVGVMNDYLFRDENSVGLSLTALAFATLPLASALLIYAGRMRRRFDWVA